MKQYLDLMNVILKEGTDRVDRTGVGTLSIFGHQLRFDMSKTFPLITTKKIHLRSIIYELLWFLKGDTNIAYLQRHGISIWDEWADANGNLGAIYGKQWRRWSSKNNGESIDQISNLVENIKSNPMSRRHVISSWNPSDIDKMALPPCHVLFQFYVDNDKLSCQLYQRSADYFLGVPFNIASYALLTHMIAQQCDLSVGNFIWTGGDIHLYKNHINQAKCQISRKPYHQPTLHIKRKPSSLFEYVFEDFEIINYQPHPAIKASIAV